VITANIATQLNVQPETISNIVSQQTHTPAGIVLLQASSPGLRTGSHRRSSRRRRAEHRHELLVVITTGALLWRSPWVAWVTRPCSSTMPAGVCVCCETMLEIVSGWTLSWVRCSR